MYLEHSGYRIDFASVNGLVEFGFDPFVEEIYNLWKERNMKGYVLKIQGKGFLLLEDKREESEMVIRGFYVKPEHRGQGIGKALLECLVEHVKNRFIWVNITEGAESLYESVKFRILGRREGYPDQFIAYLPNRLATNGKINKLKEKVVGYERIIGRTDSE